MPIANCFTYDLSYTQQQVDTLATEWSKAIDVELKDICLTFINAEYQAGQKYKVMVNLLLPSLWDRPNIDMIQATLLNQLKKNLNLNESEIFIITSIVQSGNVIENGQKVQWSK